ncbi:MAG: histidine triad nucleotide-binding protein [Bacillota bacterium]|nr:histidine triad nucleotide-binding protein [Bacillota bacterium]
MSENCLFCKIVNGTLEADFLLETENIVAFRDINPVAPVHILIIPKKHIASLAHLEEDDESLMGEIVKSTSDLADQEGLAEGYRVVVNTGSHGGQSVAHLHFHLIGGRSLQWPPG